MAASPASVASDPAYLYRYVSIQGSTRSRYLRDTLLNHRLFLASPKEFNDPFDCKTAFSLEGSKDQWRAAFAGVFERLWPHLTVEERAARVEEALRVRVVQGPETQPAAEELAVLAVLARPFP